MKEMDMLLYFDEYGVPSREIADRVSAEPVEIRVHRFPDGESLVRLPAAVPRQVIMCRSLYRPNDKLVELMFAARQARELGAEKIMLIAPYLCYMRQDKAFHPGEAVSQRIIGEFFSRYFDCVLTVDAHLHRVSALQDVMPGIEAVNLTAAGPVSDYLVSQDDRPFLIGPDEESLQWVKRIAESCSLDFGVCRKVRHGDRDVEVMLPELKQRYRRVIIIDDILSTGKTVAVAAGLLKKAGVERVDCLVTHPVFAPGAWQLLKESGVSQVISTNTIPHETNRISVAPVIADFLKGPDSCFA